MSGVATHRFLNFFLIEYIKILLRTVSYGYNSFRIYILFYERTIFRLVTYEKRREKSRRSGPVASERVRNI